MKPKLPKFLSIDPAKYTDKDIELTVNGRSYGRFRNLDKARQVMNDTALSLLEEYYPDYHFVICLTRGSNTVDCIVF